MIFKRLKSLTNNVYTFYGFLILLPITFIAPFIIFGSTAAADCNFSTPPVPLPSAQQTFGCTYFHKPQILRPAHFFFQAPNTDPGDPSTEFWPNGYQGQDTAASFISTVESDLGTGDPSSPTSVGAAFLIDDMMTGNDNDNNGGQRLGTVAGVNLAENLEGDWANFVTLYGIANLVHFNQTIPAHTLANLNGCLKTQDMSCCDRTDTFVIDVENSGTYDEGSFDNRGCTDEQYITITSPTDPGEILIAINQSCGNITGEPLPFQPIKQIQPASCNIALSNYNPNAGQNISETLSLTYTSTGSSGTVSGTMQVNVSPGGGTPNTYPFGPRAAPRIGKLSTITKGPYTLNETVAGPYTINLLIQGTANEGIGDLSCQKAFTVKGVIPPPPVQNGPYLKVYGGDVMAGSAFASSVGGDSCTANPAPPDNGTAGIYSWNTQNNPTTFVGASSQEGAFATGVVRGFGTADNIGLANGHGPPDSLTFSNTSGGLYGYGGGFTTPYCVPDYYNDLQANHAPTITPKIVGPGQSLNNILGTNAGAAYITNYGPGHNIRGFQINSPIIILATGNFTIDVNTLFPPSETATSNMSGLPMLYVVDKGGNIYINNDVNRVTNLSGVFIDEPNGNAGGTIYDCANPHTGMGPDTKPFTECTNPLTVDGSFIANSIDFERTNGTSVAAPPNPAGTCQSPDSQSAESFCYTPLIWLANPFSATNSSTNDYISEVPPTL